MSLRRAMAGIVLLASVLTTPHARAGISVGACLATLRITFTNGVIPNGSLDYVMDGSGTCQTSAGLGQPIIFNPTLGSASPATCQRLQMLGQYSVSFPGFGGSSGEFRFIGTAYAGVVVMTGSNPTFVGLAAAVGLGNLGCGNGTGSLTFSIVLGFLDP